MRGRPVLICVAALLIVAPVGSSAPNGNVSVPVNKKALAKGVLAKINAIRVANKLAPVSINAQLTAAATFHSKEMLARGYFAHESYDGTSPIKRIRKYYKGVVGENLIWFIPDVSAAKAVNTWMGNAGHRDVILDRRWREIGISALHADSAPGKYNNLPVTVITTDFGRK